VWGKSLLDEIKTGFKRKRKRIYKSIINRINDPIFVTMSNARSFCRMPIRDSRKMNLKKLYGIGKETGRVWGR